MLEDLIHVDLDRITSKKILYCNLFHVADGHITGIELVHARKIHQLTASVITQVQDIFLRFSRCAWNHHVDLIDMIFLTGTHDLISAAFNRNTIYVSAPFIWIIINETADFLFYFLGMLDVSENHLSC